MAAVTQIRQPHSEGRAYYDKKLAEGKTRKEAELVIGLVAYAPLGLGFLTGTIEPGSLDSANFGASNPRFQGQAGEANMASATTLRRVARRIGAEPAQVVLGWFLPPTGLASRSS